MASIPQKITYLLAAVLCCINVRASTETGMTLKGNLNSKIMIYSKVPKKCVETFTPAKRVGMIDTWHTALPRNRIGK